MIVLIFSSMRNNKEKQPPASLGLSYFREDRQHWNVHKSETAPARRRRGCFPKGLANPLFLSYNVRD